MQGDGKIRWPDMLGHRIFPRQFSRETHLHSQPKHTFSTFTTQYIYIYLFIYLYIYIYIYIDRAERERRMYIYTHIYIMNCYFIVSLVCLSSTCYDSHMKLHDLLK